jgi:hypothetical protein
MTSRSNPDTADEAVSVRWLAELCGFPSTALVPSLASTLLATRETAHAVTQYLAWWIRHPNPGSAFDRATRHLIDQPDSLLIETLRGMHYDGLLYRRDGEIVWHVFFQRHGADLCAFSCSVGESRGGRIWPTIAADFTAYASALAGVRRVRWGSGNHPITSHFLTLIEPHAGKLGWRVFPDGRIEFSP